ncbi:hypothetical protein FJ364_02530 [Candidatus Dependentiae bacterium]|nr:hypothetical protein [Candidatus Dependentiae bacterium]
MNRRVNFVILLSLLILIQVRVESCTSIKNNDKDVAEQEKYSGDRFDQLLDDVLFESHDLQERLEGYKRLILYANDHDVASDSIEKFLRALEATFRARDLANRVALVYLQDVLCIAAQAKSLALYQNRLKQLLDKLSYDLQPFGIRGGDYVVLEVPARKLFCAAEHRADGIHVLARPVVSGREVRVDCLFRVATPIPGALIKFGDAVQLEPLYIRYGCYILPPATRLGISYNEQGRRGSSISPLIFKEKDSSLITFVSPQGPILSGAPIVADQGVCLVDAASGAQWALRGDEIVSHIDHNVKKQKSNAEDIFSLRNIKPEIIDFAHKRLIQANIDVVFKQKRFEDRVFGITQLLNSMRSGFDFDQQEQLRKALEALYDEHAKASTRGLRKLDRLFGIAANHPNLVENKLMLQQFVGHVREALNDRSVAYGDIFSLVTSNHQAALQAEIHEKLTELGHLAISTGRTQGDKILGQQCLIFTSPHGKRGSITYGDEVTIHSFFVEDGREGELLACPVIWWVDPLDKDSLQSHRVLASSIKAVQTHNGQEIFIVQHAKKEQKGTLITGDKIELFSKYAEKVLTFGDKAKEGVVFELHRIDKDQLIALADKRFKQYVQRAFAEKNISKKIQHIEVALDIFKGQRLLSIQASKILYGIIRVLTANKADLEPNDVSALKKLLAKAQGAPFSVAAKKRFKLWHDKLTETKDSGEE